jgi:hypothetical protein
MPHISIADDTPLTQDFQTRIPALPQIDESQPLALTEGLDFNSSTLNPDNILVSASPAVDHDDPSASGFSSFLEDNIQDSTNNINEDGQSKELAKVAFLSKKISYIRQGVLGNKDLFLVDPTSHPDIDDSIELNGIITNVPYKGSQEYSIEWGTWSLEVALPKSSLCYTVVKNDTSRMVMLKLARFEFSYVHPSGPGGIANVGLICRTRKPKKKQRVSEEGVSDARNNDVIRRNQQLANLHTSAVDSSETNVNQPNRTDALCMHIQYKCHLIDLFSNVRNFTR